MKSDWHFCNPGALSSHLPGDGPGALPLRYSYGETTSRLLSIKGIKTKIILIYEIPNEFCIFEGVDGDA